MYRLRGGHLDRDREEEAEREGGEIGSGLRFRSRIGKKRCRCSRIEFSVAVFLFLVDRGGFGRFVEVDRAFIATAGFVNGPVRSGAGKELGPHPVNHSSPHLPFAASFIAEFRTLFPSCCCRTVNSSRKSRRKNKMAVNRASCDHWEQKMEPERAAEEQQGADTGTDAAASSGGCFDCNICLDFAADPVVTLCGHLYCWPCIYQWLQQDDGAAPRQCPVCKAALLPRSFVPLYGRGSHVPAAAHLTPPSSDVPRRPSFRHEATAVGLLPTSSPLIQEQQQQQPHVPSPTPPPPLRAMHSTSVEVLWGMAVAVLPWVCRRGYESPYGGGSARTRRRELAVERTLHHIWVFLFCCVMLCLFLF